MNRGTLLIAIATVMLFPCATANAQATLRVGSADGVEGEEVEVSILMDTDDGGDGAVVFGTMQVKHDGDVLRLEEIAPGEDLEEAAFFATDVEPGLGGQLGFLVSFFGETISGTDLELAVLRYGVVCDADVKETSVELTSDLDPAQPIELINDAGDSSDFETESGVITVLSALEPCSTPPLPAPPCQVEETATLTGSDTQDDDRFGIDVAASEEFVVVGAWFADDEPDDRAGAAYVFSQDADTGEWVESVRLEASTPVTDEHFGASVAISGDCVVIGARGDSGSLFDPDDVVPGMAYFFCYDESSDEWVDGGGFEPVDPPPLYPGLGFGHSVAISDDVAVVGAPIGLDGFVNAFVRDPDTGEWSSAQETAILSDVESDDFGHSVAVTPGKRIVVGAPSDGELGDDAGAVYIFDRVAPSGEWELGVYIKLTASDGEAGDRFGGDVAATDIEIVVGASGADDGAGAVYLFTRDPKTDEWTEESKLTASDAASGDGLGRTVAISGDRIAAYSPCDGIGLASGKIYTFLRIPELGTWVEEAKLVPSSPQGLTDGFSLVGDRVFHGSTSEGSVDIFEIDCKLINGFLRGDCNGDGVVSGIPDALYLLRYGFTEGPAPPCSDAADTNDDGVVSAIPDALYLLKWAFGDGPVPPDPGPVNCGLDPDSGDALECEMPTPCN